MSLTNIARVTALAGAALGSAAIIGCDQEATIRAQISDSFPEGFVQTKVFVAGAKIAGEFNFDGQEVSVDCSITVVGTVGGKKVVKTVGATLRAKGSKGGTYELDCSDPLLLQMPADVTGVSATAAGAGGVFHLPVTEGLASVPIAPGEFLDAEPGMQLVVIEYPPGMPPALYDLSLGFGLASSRDIDVKPIITGKVICDGEVYLPPIVPPVKSMDAVAAVTLPVAPFAVEILPPLDGVADIVDMTIDCQHPSCAADCDESGALDFFDFLCFQNLFATGAREADCDDSGVLDFFDFLCFQNRFAAGCP